MRENGITVCSTTDTITVYWPTLKNSAADRTYTILLDGREVGTTQRTHYTLENLAPGARYQVTVLVDGLLMDRQEAVTAPRRRRLDVKQLGAAGDGRTKDTEILQTAINRCGPEQEVYLPAGIYSDGSAAPAQWNGAISGRGGCFAGNQLSRGLSSPDSQPFRGDRAGLLQQPAEYG